MSSTSRRRFGAVVSYVILAVVVLAAAWVLLNRQFALDTLTNWTFQPSNGVSELASRTKLTPKGVFIYNATQPELLDETQFNKECPRQEMGSPILGCYTSADRIYIYDVTDAKLEGIREVTAVHELLHAVWVRTSSSEQKRLETLLREAYAKIKNDNIADRMDYYQRTAPGEIVNELHSILGTEVSGLGSELEEYYAQYFSRNTVLAFQAQYEGRYTALIDKANGLVTDMQNIGAMIDADSQRYVTNSASLSEDIGSFNTRASGGGFRTVAQFNAERAALVTRSDQLEADRAAINARIESYNVLHAEYQKITGELQLLTESLDSYKVLEAAPSI